MRPQEVDSMNETHVFLVPDYYPRFKCKMGACRHACCEGWPVTVSLKDYYRLLGEECDKSLRRRIDMSLKILPHPTEDEYAEITHDYNGVCHLRMPDGRCALQAKMGEDALSPVCRLYPRGVRSEGDYECSCACSCEATLEQLFQEKEPICFIPYETTLFMPETKGRTVYFETVGREQEIRLHFIRLMQNRAYPLHERLILLSDDIMRMEKALNAKDEQAVDALLESELESVGGNESQPTQEQLAYGISVAEHLMELMDERSESLRQYGEQALAYFGQGGNSLERYFAARNHFETLFPDWEIFFENMLVNHMFFGRFPFQDRDDSLRQEKIALDAVYVLLRFGTLGCMASSESTEDLIDICCAGFRLIDHTSFDRYAGRMLERLGCDTEEKQRWLLEL